MASLPVEILDHIAAGLHRRTLLALATVDSRCYHVAQRLLYRSLALDAAALPCLFTLAARPDIARHVRAFSIRIPDDALLLAPVFRALTRALTHMSELVSLDIALNHAASAAMRTPPATRFHALRSCSVAFPLDDHLADFLSKAPRLRELHIHSPDPPRPLPPAALPILQHFSGPSLIAQAVVPGRPVHDIHLTSGDLTEDLAESLAASTAPIRILAAATSSQSFALLTALSRSMQHLVHLRIVTYNFTDTPDLSYFKKVTDALAAFPHLQSCEIWGLHWVASRKSRSRKHSLRRAS